ncbi:MAG: tetratricopeptide repeat protein [Flavobacteriaceae bacterium]
MKVNLTLISILIFSFGVFAQKKELKSIQKLVDATSYSAALASLEEVSPLMETAEPKYTAHYHYLSGVSKQATKQFEAALADYNLVSEIERNNKSKKYTTLIDAGKAQFTNELVNHAIELNSLEKFSEASDALYLAYTLDEENNADYLYFAASSAVNALVYDKAMKYYQALKSMNYTGISTKHYATEVATGEEIEIDAATAKIYAKSKEFTNIREEETESRLPEIVKNIALIHLNQGNNDKAMAAVKDARKLSPKDIGLILTEADLYIKLGDQARFASLMQEAIEQDPNNAILYYNLGVVNANEGNRDAAIDYYKKSIELDSSYEASYLNIASVILEGESAIVDEMNSLGTSNADNRKYDLLKEKREGLFLDAVPYLEQLISINPKSVEALTTLKNIYGTIGDTAKFKQYRDMLDSL